MNDGFFFLRSTNPDRASPLGGEIIVLLSEYCHGATAETRHGFQFCRRLSLRIGTGSSLGAAWTSGSGVTAAPLTSTPSTRFGTMIYCKIYILHISFLSLFPKIKRFHSVFFFAQSLRMVAIFLFMGWIWVIHE